MDNEKKDIQIPINIDCILGISAVVKDIIQKQTEIYTKYLTFND